MLAITNIVELLDEELKKGNAKAIAALIEWAALTVMIGHINHVLRHIEPAVLEEAVRESQECTDEGGSTLH